MLSAPKSCPFRYEWIWEKTNPTGFLNAKRMPLKTHENVYIFYKKLPKYNPQFTKGKPYKSRNHHNSSNYGSYKKNYLTINNGIRYPRDVLKISNVGYTKQHPTQKPTEILEYLIKTYTDEGDLVLDSTMGSGSTGVAAINTNRDFIGIELDNNYFEIAERRINEAYKSRLHDCTKEY
nr:MAG TPA: adenine-specific methyltransferase [Caudoviricetes sp.]